MPDRSKWFEILISACGLAVTGLLGYAQYGQSSRQLNADQTHEADTIEVQVMTLVGPHLANLAKPNADLEASEKVVLAAAEYLSVQYSRTALATMAAKITDGNKAVSPDVLERIQEATAPPSGNWLVVIATLPKDDLAGAKSKANSLLAQVQAQPSLHEAQVQIYQTNASNRLFVVLGGPKQAQLEKSVARDYVAAARGSFAPRAYSQFVRQWAFQGAAPFQP